MKNSIKQFSFITITTTLFISVYTNSFWLQIIKKNDLIPDEIKFKYYFSFFNSIQNAQYDIHINFKNFFIVILLGALISCITAWYIKNNIANIKHPNKASKIDKVFISIILILIAMPTIYINQEPYSVPEARTLQKYVPLYNKKNKTINIKYGETLNNYFNDRFFGRLSLIHLNRNIIHDLSNKYVRCGAEIIDKSQKILFRYWEPPSCTDDTAIRIGAELKRFQKYCNNLNIKLYIAITPDKNSIYSIKAVRKNLNEIHKKQIYAISKNHNLNIAFPLDKLLNENKISKYRMYYATDHHTTDDGAFIMYQELMKMIKKDYSRIEVLDSSDFNYYYNNLVMSDKSSRKFHKGKTCSTTGISSNICLKYLNYQYRYYKHKDFDNLIKEDIEYGYLYATKYYYPKGADYRVMILGDSSINSFAEYIPFNFKYVLTANLNYPHPKIPKMSRYKVKKYHEKEIKDFKPDIIILCLGHYYLEKLLDLTQN